MCAGCCSGLLRATLLRLSIGSGQRAWNAQAKAARGLKTTKAQWDLETLPILVHEA